MFLFHTPGLDKRAIGEYLGENDELNIQVMHSFVDNMALAQMSFLPALRQFLRAFQLPGEAQKIDRFMLKFAERYVHLNAFLFPNAGSYVTAECFVRCDKPLRCRVHARLLYRPFEYGSPFAIRQNQDGQKSLC